MRKQAGISLVELMISITLGLLLMTGLIQMFGASKSIYVTQKSMSRVQETGRLALEFIGRDVRMASYFGYLNIINQSYVAPTSAASASSTSSYCSEKYNVADPISPNAVSCSSAASTGASLSGLHQNFREGFRGYLQGGASSTPNIDSQLGSSFTIAPGSDIIVLHGAIAGERGMPNIKPNDATRVFGYTDQIALTSSNCIEGFCAGGVAVISDGKKGRLFQIKTKPALDTATKTVTLTHTDTWDINDNSNVFCPKNSVNCPPTVFGAEELDAIILPVHTISYFVATGTALGSMPALWQKIDNQNAVELMPGVENMYIEYTTNGTQYVRPGSVSNWDALIAMKVQLLVRGSEANDQDAPQQYTFGSATPPITPSDKFMRQVFTSTFALRDKIK